jgi:hypothetical protein
MQSNMRPNTRPTAPSRAGWGDIALAVVGVALIGLFVACIWG